MELLNTNITLKGLEDKGKTMTVIDTNDIKYSIWKKDYKNPGMDSEAYSSLLNFRLGETFGVSYGEKAESFTNDQGKLINFTRRTIYSIMPPIDNPTPRNPLYDKTPHSGANTASQDKSETFWEQQAYEKCCSLWAASRLQANDSFEDILGVIKDGEFYKLFQAIKADGKKRFFVFSAADKIEEIPTIQIQEPSEADMAAMVEEIPF